jgi:chorismate dehydratase
MGKIRISAVKYANTYPFIYGLIESGFDKKVILETDHPANCAAKLISGAADIGLIPVAALLQLNNYTIVSDYCIGSDGNVRTVMLMSNTPFEEIKTIYLDYRSRSSVNLTKVLAMNFWKKDYTWVETNQGFDFAGIKNKEAVVLIGDQCFEFENSFKYKVDLAKAWKDFTGLPFVFACWTSNKKIDNELLKEFNAALKKGVDDIDGVVKKFSKISSITGEDLRKYLTENINFEFDNRKKEALNLFLNLMKKLP